MRGAAWLVVSIVLSVVGCGERRTPVASASQPRPGASQVGSDAASRSAPGRDEGASPTLPESSALTNFSPLAGTPYLTADLHTTTEGCEDATGETARRAGYRGEHRTTVNRLTYDREGRAFRWLFPSNAQAITRVQPLLGQGAATGSPPRGLFYLVAARAAGACVDPDRPRRLVFSDPAGTFAVPLADSVSGFGSTYWLRDSTLLVLVRQGDRPFGVELDVAQGKVVRAVVPPPPPR